MTTTDVRVVVIGGGQAGLAAGYYLRRAGLGYVILDDQPAAGGSWREYWPSLHLFSPAAHSRLPGWPMPPSPREFPPGSHVVGYLSAYEQRYELPVQRPVTVTAVRRNGSGYLVETTAGSWSAEAVINATGTWSRPFWPTYPGMRTFQGRQIHTAQYDGPDTFTGQRVAVVGGGNSATQILAEISTVADTLWFTTRPPRFLPDDVDGRVLFDVATRRAHALAAGDDDTGGVAGLGDVVMVPSVRDARDRGALRAHPMFAALTAEGVVTDEGGAERVDAVLWCTGFRPSLRHLQPLHLPTTDGGIAMDGLHAAGEPTMVFLGYGDWTGPASATLIGVGSTARHAVRHLTATLTG